MNIFEGYKKAVEIYNKNSGTEDGRKTVTWYNNKLGVSKEYLVWFTTCVICYGIPLYAVLHTYRDWKRYVVSYYKKTSQPIPNIESLNYQQTMKIINECKRQWAKPNPIYNQNGVYVGEFKSFSDANMLPINTNWCITKTKSRYNEFNNENSKCLYIINNSNQDPWRRVIAVVYTDRVEYWDSTNIRIDDNAPYEKTLPIEAVNIIHSRYQNNTNENKQHKTRYNMKKTIRLSEADLHRVIKESVNRVLNEIGDTRRGQYMLGRLRNRQSNNGGKFFRGINYNDAGDYAYKANGNSYSKHYQEGFHDEEKNGRNADSTWDRDKYGKIKFNYDAKRMADMDDLGKEFIDFIEKHDGGVLLQTIVEYESGNQTGKKESPLKELIPYFEEEVLGHECTPDMVKAIENAYNQWWYYAEGILCDGY